MENEYNLLTDFYFFRVSYIQFLKGDHLKNSVYEYYFRKNPFGLNYTIFGGLSDFVEILKNFKFSDSDIDFIKNSLELNDNDKYLDILRNFNYKDITVTSLNEGSIIFPYNPILTLEGPLIWLNLLEGLILNILNFPSLISTYASLLKLKANDKHIAEFGLRRAQGQNGALTASKYSYIGGASFSSNLLFCKKYNIKPIGTMSHSYIMSFSSIKNISFIENFPTKLKISNQELIKKTEEIIKINSFKNINISELISFITFFMTYPNNFLCLIDTYDVFKSGIPNYLIVSLLAYNLGFSNFGVRFDSGDLYQSSIEFKNILKEFDCKNKSELLKFSKIAISNDLDERIIEEIESKNTKLIDVYCVGTNLVTCKKQPALGIIGKLIELDNTPCMKFNKDKLMFPFKKNLYKCYLKNNDLSFIYIMTLCDENIEVLEEFYDFHSNNYIKFDIIKYEILNFKIENFEFDIQKTKDYVTSQIKELKENYQLDKKLPLIFTKKYIENYKILKENLIK